MDKKWNKVPLAAAISAIVAAPVWAADDVTAINGQASVDNNLSVNYNGGTNSGGESINSSTLTGNSFDGASGIVHSNTAAGFANLGSNTASMGITETTSSEYDIAAQSEQLSDGNDIELKRDAGGWDNSSTVSGSTYNGSKGVLGANVTSGVANVQGNTVAVGHTDKVTGSSSSLGVTSSSGQTVADNDVLALGADNNSKLIGGFDGAAGIVGVNVSAGSINQQSNTVALAKGDLEADLYSGPVESNISTVSTSSTQTISGNELTANGSNFLGNSAVTQGVFNKVGNENVKGIVGSNSAAGDLNAQSNNTSLAFIAEKSKEWNENPAVSVSSSSSQTISENDINYVNNVNTSSNSSTLSNSFVDFQGIAGSNTASGQANAQSNSASVAYVDNDSIPLKVNTKAESSQTIQDNFTIQYLAGAGVYGNMINSASISGGAFNGAEGLIGANSAAGQGNAQSNNASLAYLEGGAGNIGSLGTDGVPTLDTSASSTQTVSSNTTSLDDPAKVDGDIQHSEAKISSSFSGVTGIVGTNVSAGQNNTQVNNAVVARYADQSGATSSSANNSQDVKLNFTSNFDNTEVVGDGVAAIPIAKLTNEASISEAFESEATGIIGASAAAGQANVQSNNVVFTYNEAPTYGSTATGDHAVQANNKQVVASNYTALHGVDESSTVDGEVVSIPVVENTATISNSFNNSRGVIGSNVASGQANAQSNNVAVGYVEKALDTPSTAVSAETKSLQKIGGGTENLVGAGNSNTGIYQGDPIDNVATIGGTDTEVFNGANGILGLNVTAGQFNAQGNNVSVVATKNGTELDATTVNIQASIRNDVSYQSLSASTNNATLSNSFVEANGVIGVNLAVGVANGQTNNVALHAGDSVTSTNAVAANIQASVGNAGVGSTSGFESIADSDTTDPLESLVGNYQVADYALSNVYTFDNSGDTDALSIASAGNIASIGGTAFQGANGVIGVNVSAGVGNLQSNNVSLTVASLTTN